MLRGAYTRASDVRSTQGLALCAMSGVVWWRNAKKSTTLLLRR